MNILNNSCRISKIKNESLNLGPKLPYLDIFKLTFQKKKVIFKATSIFLQHKVLSKIKYSKFKTKNPLFGYFWDEN